MKLFYSPGACSLASHIALQEAGLKFELTKVDTKTKTTDNSGDFWKVNPKGYVPALQLDSGQVMTECVAIMQWVADQVPDKNLIPAWTTAERYKAIEWLNFIATEVHKSFAPLWKPNTPDATKALAKETIAKRFDLLEDHFKTNDYMMGTHFSVVDGYLFTVMRWAGFHGIDMKPWPNMTKFFARIEARPAVKTALDAENAQP